MATGTEKRPWLAVALAFVYPGLGHVYLREWLRALVWFGLVVTSSTLLVPESAVPTGFSVDALVAAARAVPLEAALALLSITLFSMIDAYWVAKRTNKAAAVEDGTTCPHCGKDIDPEIDFCHWCTEPLQPADEPEPDQPADEPEPEPDA